MPSAVHEAAFDHLVTKLKLAFDEAFGSSDGSVKINVHTNSELQGNAIYTIPDILVDLRYMTKTPSLPSIQPLSVLECAFSQSNADVLRKFESQIASFPELLSVAKIIIKESPAYSAPSESRINERTPIRTLDMFMSGKKSTKILTARRHGTTWMNIIAVEMQMWVRTGKEPIDVRSEGTRSQICAKGVRYLFLRSSSVY